MSRSRDPSASSDPLMAPSSAGGTREQNNESPLGVRDLNLVSTWRKTCVFVLGYCATATVGGIVPLIFGWETAEEVCSPYVFVSEGSSRNPSPVLSVDFVVVLFFCFFVLLCCLEYIIYYIILARKTVMIEKIDV